MADQEPSTGTPASGVPGQAAPRQESGFYEPYAGFARALRLWFIAYGVGAPGLLLTSDPALKAVAASGAARSIAYCFLAGVVVQILVALLYKTAMWYLYMGELEETAKSWQLHEVSRWLSERYWVEFAADVITLCLFGAATLRVVQVVLP